MPLFFAANQSSCWDIHPGSLLILFFELWVVWFQLGEISKPSSVRLNFLAAASIISNPRLSAFVGKILELNTACLENHRTKWIKKGWLFCNFCYPFIQFWDKENWPKKIDPEVRTYYRQVGYPRFCIQIR